MSKYKVLVIDDDPTQLKVLMKSVEKAGHEPVGAKDGREAIEAFKKNRPMAMVIADMMLPNNIKGTEVLEKIKKAAPETVRIIVTSSPDVEVMEQAINQGEIFRFLKKPVDVKAAKASIQSGVEQYEKSKSVRGQMAQAKSHEKQVKLLTRFAFFLAVLVIGLFGLNAFLFLQNRAPDSFVTASVPEETEPAEEEPEELEKKEQIEKALREIEKKAEAKEFQAALDLLQTLNQEHRDNTEIMNLYSRVYLLQDRLGDAAQWAKASLKVNPDQGIPKSVMGRVYFSQGLFDQAIEESRVAIIYDPLQGLPYQTIGEVYLRRGRAEEALKLILEAERFFPDRLEIKNLLCATYLKLKQYNKALEEGKKALEMDPEFPNVHFNLSLVYFYLNDPPKSIEHINLAEKFYTQQDATMWIAKSRHTKNTILKKFNMSAQ